MVESAEPATCDNRVRPAKTLLPPPSLLPMFHSGLTSGTGRSPGGSRNGPHRLWGGGCRARSGGGCARLRSVVCAAAGRLSAVVGAMLTQTARAHNFPPSNRVGESSQWGGGGAGAGRKHTMAPHLTRRPGRGSGGVDVPSRGGGNHGGGGRRRSVDKGSIAPSGAATCLPIATMPTTGPHGRHRPPAARVRPQYATASPRTHHTAWSVQLV